MVRNMNNNCQWFASCGTEVHAYGLIIGACYWHTRGHFAAAYGAAGKTMMDDYLYQHFHAGPQNEIESCMDMMLLNDNDANLANGTPDAGLFYQGFTVQHSVPFPIPLITINHNPLRDTMDQLQNYQVHATASALPGLAGAITTGTTYYSVNGGVFTALPMSLVGSEYVAAIPVQPAGTTIRYYLEFQDSLAHVQKLPAGGAAAPFSFLTFRRQTFFSDSFEAPSGWVSAQVVTQNDWQNGAPGNPSHAYDPPSAFDGTQCWGNDLSIGNFNGNYQNNVNNNLTSPTLNCSGQTNVSIVYRRWLTVEDGTFDHARILVSNNNGGTFNIVWQNPVGAHLIDTGWVEHAVDISALANNQPQVKVRYELVTDAGLVFGGWSIDAFTLASSNAAVADHQPGKQHPGRTRRGSRVGSPERRRDPRGRHRPRLDVRGRDRNDLAERRLADDVAPSRRERAGAGIRQPRSRVHGSWAERPHGVLRGRHRPRGRKPAAPHHERPGLHDSLIQDGWTSRPRSAHTQARRGASRVHDAGAHVESPA